MIDDISIVHVEDDDGDAELIARALRAAGRGVASTRVQTEEEFLRAIEPAPDVVLSDYNLPRFDALRALELLRARHPDVPFIVVSGTIGEEKAAETIRLGADDYVLKDRLARLPTAIRNAVRGARERASARIAEEALRRLDQLSYYDPLTSLPNRMLFHERLKIQLEDAARKDERLALLFLDIERFKQVNDGLGRRIGDAVLAELARRLPLGSLATSWYARLEADHFTIVMPGLDGGAAIARRSEQRYAEVFGAPFEVAGDKLRLSARYGIALFPDDAGDAEGLLRNAEAALKKAKATGERYVFYTQEMTARVAEKLVMENRLQRALEEREFVLHYQPKFETASRRIIGLEALIRWGSPDLGLVSPAEFVPLLEQTGLILPVGAWALGQAAREHAAWARAGLSPPRVAVNVSALQLRQRDFVETLERLIGEGVSPTAIDLELTETVVMEDIQTSIEKLREVRRRGIGVAIDDFGTGYSSLSYLARLPVEALKIDRSFVATMAHDTSTMTLVQTMISLAHSLGLKVIAEGVETEEQARFLRLLQCDQMHGYLLSRPLPGTQIVALLSSQH